MEEYIRRKLLLVVYANDTAGNTGTSETIYFSLRIQQSESFPTLTVVTIVIIAVVGAALLVYFRKIKKTTFLYRHQYLYSFIYKRRLPKHQTTGNACIAFLH